MSAGVHDALADLGRPRRSDGLRRADDDRLHATYVLQGGGTVEQAAEAVVIEESTGTTRYGPDVGRRVGGAVDAVEVAGEFDLALTSPPLARLGVTRGEIGRATVSWPAENATSVSALLGLVAGETFETGTFAACRLVGVSAPDAILEMARGPRRGIAGTRAALGVHDRPVLGAIVKPSTGLAPAEFAAVAADLARGGADFVKDDEILTDPPHCRFAARVRATCDALDAVAAQTGRRAAYAPNVTGDIAGLSRRIEFASRHGSGMLMVNVLTMGMEVLRYVADSADVPVLAHRVMAGALTRSPDVGVAPGVLAGVTRLSGGDLVQAGAIYGKIFEDDSVVVDSADNCLRDLGVVAAAMPVSGGGQSAETVVRNAAAFAGQDFCHLLGSAAVDDPAGAEVGAAKALVAWREELR